MKGICGHESSLLYNGICPKCFKQLNYLRKTLRTKVVIGCIVRNRAWILHEYLERLEKIEFPNKMYLFLENDSTDETYNILTDFLAGHTNNTVLSKINTGHDGWERGQYNKDGYENMANLRNEFIEQFLKTDGDYLLSIDSDILVPADILEKLLTRADNNTIIGAAISNVPREELDGKTPGNFLIDYDGQILHPEEYPLQGLMNVDVIGAVYLIPRRVFEAGIRYGTHPQGEDIYFCQRAKEKGFAMKVTFDVKCDHRMVNNK